MKNINISKKKYSELQRINIDRRVTNTEGIIYLLDYNGKIKVFKSLFNNTGITFANKLFNIELLSYYKDILPNSFCIPDSLVTVNKEIKGFTLDLINGKI